MKKRESTIHVAKTKVQISCAVTAPLFSHIQKADFLMTWIIDNREAASAVLKYTSCIYSLDNDQTMKGLIRLIKVFPVYISVLPCTVSHITVRN